MNIGDSNQNVYIGSNAGNAPSNATAFVTYYNTAAGISAGAGISNVSNSEFFGYLAGNSAKFVSNTVVIGGNAGGLDVLSNSVANIYNSVLIGTSNSRGLSNVSNTISIGGNGGGGGSSNVFIGTSNGIGAAGSSNLVIGCGSGSNMTGTRNVVIGTTVYPANLPAYSDINGTTYTVPTDMSNKFFLGSGSNVLAAGDFSKGVLVIGSTNTNSWSYKKDYPTQTIANISLDVYNYARFQNGISIGRDPGEYTLDVNGQFRVSDGVGQIKTTTVATNSYLDIQPAETSTGPMTLRLTGNMNVSGANGANGIVSAPGYCSFQSSNMLARSASITSVNSNSPAPGQATYTTTTPHGFVPNQTIAISIDRDSPLGFSAGYVGLNAVILGVLTPTTFYIANTTTFPPTTGTASVGVVYSPGIAKNGLLVGCVYDQAGTSNCNTGNVLVRSIGTGNSNLQTNILAVGSLSFLVYSNTPPTGSGLPANSIAFSNMTGANLTIGYNFTQFPTS
jgi:hypothetical protein